jgi:hypothetical protein
MIDDPAIARIQIIPLCICTVEPIPSLCRAPPGMSTSRSRIASAPYRFGKTSEASTFIGPGCPLCDSFSRRQS